MQIPIYIPEVVSTTLSILSQYWCDEEIRKEERMYISKTEAQATFDAYINLVDKSAIK